MRDFLTFRSMLTPMVLRLLFWLGLIAVVYTAVMHFMDKQMMDGLLTLLIGPVVVRVVTEFLILFFRMNETLTEVKHVLEEKSSLQLEVTNSQ